MIVRVLYLVLGIVLGLAIGPSIKPAKAGEPKVWVLMAAFELSDGTVHLSVRNDPVTKTGDGKPYPMFYKALDDCMKDRAKDAALVASVAREIEAAQAALECVEVDRTEFLNKIGIKAA